MKHSRLRYRLGALAAGLGLLIGFVPVASSVTAAGAATADPVTGITLKVISGAGGSTTAPYASNVHAGDPIATYKWLINDDSGTGNPTDGTEAIDQPIKDCLPAAARPTTPAPANTPLAKYNNAGAGNLKDCQWPSVHSSPGHAEVIASGNQDDVARLAQNLPAGKYLISVTSPGFKIDGAHFTVDANRNVIMLNGEQVLDANGQPQGQAIVVAMNPLPKKTSTIRVHVFNDNASTNGQWDGQTETLVTCSSQAIVDAYPACGGVIDALAVADPTTDMAGFVAHIADVLAEVTTDVYGNPLCTEYIKDANGNVLLADDGTPTPVSFGDAGTALSIPSAGGASGSQLAGTESLCISDHYGDIEIPNMGPNRYAVTVIAPDPKTHNADKWIETTTLEGGHDWDTWNQEGSTGYDTELVVGGERVTPVTFGFVKVSHTEDLFAMASKGDANAAAQYYDAAMPGGNGSLSGAIKIGRAFIGATGTAALAGTNLSNAIEDTTQSIDDGIVSINCLATCNAPTDSAVWVGRAKTDGSFTVNGLQTGDYGIALWDESQNYILATLQYHVDGGNLGANDIAGNTEMGHVLLPGWFTDIQGSVFVDSNEDGKRDAGEEGVPDFFLSIRTRGNSLQDQGSATSVTNDSGAFDLSQGYPLGQFVILEAYNPRFRNTGFTYKTDNDAAHTVATSQVDVNILPVIGLSAKIDWGVKPYDQGTNGGIAGTVTYDTTRNELNPRESLQEDYQPGVSGIAVQMWGTSRSNGAVDHYGAADGGAALQIGKTNGGATCTRSAADLGTDAVLGDQPCKPLGYYTTESWTRPTGCKALDAFGHKLDSEQSLPAAPTVVDYSHTDPNQPDCVEAPMSGLQIGGDGTVDGNYAFGAIVKNPSSDPASYDEGANAANFSDSLPPADYVVEAVSPVDTVMSSGADVRHKYAFTDETAVNIATGDSYVPEHFAHDPSSAPADPGYNLSTTNRKIRVDTNSLATGRDAACVGSSKQVPNNDDPAHPESFSGLGLTNPDFNAIGGSTYAGDARPTCGDKLVTVVNGRSTNPTFFVYTEVPIPTKFYGLINDDLNVQTDRRSIMLGEVAGQANGPIGVYDELGNRKFTAHSDPNGFYEVLLPSTDTYNCPLPAGPCPNVYRLVGNDPGTLDHPNADYNPQFRTIATDFQGWPGVVHPVDQAPTHIGITIEGPPSQFGALSLCKLDATNPVIYRIDKPYLDPATDTAHSYVVQGTGFGTSGRLTLTSATGVVTNIAVTAANWTNTKLTFVVPTLAAGPYQLGIRANGLSTVNGLTFHVLGAGYLARSDVYEVTPDIANDNVAARTYTPQHDAWDADTNTAAGFAGIDVNGVAVSGGRAIQRAIEAAHGANGNNPKLIVIYPNSAPNYAPHNAFGAYFENVVVHGKVKLQGVGPGGTGVLGTTLDAQLFWAATQVVPAGANQQTADGNYSDDWRTFTAGINKVSTTDIVEGEAVLAVAEAQTQYGGVNAPAASTLFRTGVDAMLITGGNQQGFPNNIANPPGAAGNGNGGEGAAVVGPAQGGAITLDQYVRDFAITNNQVQSNGGTYGSVRIGTPDLPEPATNNHNERLVVANNRMIANGGTNLAGALGIFAGTDGYTVSGNDLCGNFSAEYGGAISHYGLSPNGTITHNRIYYNQSYDEGGGIMIAGQLPAANATVSPGAGKVTIDANYVEANLSNDDGGGIRFLMAGAASFDVVNNVIANNVATHEGAGIALDDAPNVVVRNNTIVKNQTTATAVTSDHRAAPAGLSTGGNSSGLQATLANHSPNYSKPVLLNNLFADNRAGAADVNSGAITGIGAAGDASPIQRWDVGSFDSTGSFCDSFDKTTSTCDAGSAAHITMTSSVVNSVATGDGALPRPGSLSYDAATFTGDAIGAAIDGAADDQIHFVHPVDFQVDSLRWRVNTNVSFPVIIAVNAPITKLTDYHLATSGLYARNVGAANAAAPNAAVTAPALDIDGEGRPAQGGYERGADELGVYADLAVTKTDNIDANRKVRAGGVVTYNITVTNFGPSPVAGAAVTDTLPSTLPAASAAWTCAAVNGTCATPSGTGNLNTTVSLSAGGVATYALTATVAANAGPGLLINTATVAVPAGMTDPDPSNNSAQSTLTIEVPVNLSITKTDNRAGFVNRSQLSITYTVVVANGGPSTAKAHVADVMPSQLLAAAWTCAATSGGSCGGAPTFGVGAINRDVTVAAGGKVTYTIGALLQPTAPSGPMVNTATVAPLAGYVDTSAGNDSATDTVIIRGSGNLAIAKTVTPTGNVARGGTVTYTVTATNTSPLGDTAIGATVVDSLPATITNATWTCATGAGSSCGATASGIGNINQAVNVANGVPVVFTVTGTVSSTAPLNAAIANTATVAAPATFTDTGGANSSTATNTVRPSGNLTVTKTANKPSVSRVGNAIGRQVLYTVVVANSAGGDTATNALFTESAPAGLTFNTWTCGTPVGGATCAAANGSGRPVNQGSTLPGGGSVTYRITVTVNANAPLGALTNTVTLAPPANFIDPAIPNSASATVQVTA